MLEHRLKRNHIRHQRRDDINGLDGRDTIYGLCGNDAISGDDDWDYVIKGYDDTIYGGPGDDSLSQESGDGNVYGSDGNDDLSGGSGRSKLFGGPGNDTVRATEAHTFWPGDPDTPPQNPDYAYCGPGKDTVYYNKGLDKVHRCEIKHPKV